MLSHSCREAVSYIKGIIKDWLIQQQLVHAGGPQKAVVAQSKKLDVSEQEDHDEALDALWRASEGKHALKDCKRRMSTDEGSFWIHAC